MRWRRVGLAVFILLVLSALGILAGLQWLRTGGRARREGSLALRGLQAEVTVRFDLWGVPHVQAESARDLALALGWLHANDRMAQLELGRRAASGRLSELFGEGTLALDRRMRTLRLRRTAERTWELVAAEGRLLLEAYAEGVNAWLEERDGDLPPELLLLRADPEPWKPVDSLCFFLLMARDLSYPAEPDELRYRWLGALGPERLRNLVGDPSLEIPSGMAQHARESAANRAQVSDEDESEERNGSNNWAVGSARSATGHPLVANDPHLALGLPNTWYQVLLRAPDYEAAGMTLPGLPMVVIGQSRELAWAFTNTELDTNDLFIEELDPEARSVRRGRTWLPIVSERETIIVRGGDDVDLELRSTDRGPLLEADPKRGLPLRSLCWTGYTPFDPVTPFVELARVVNVAQVSAAIADFVCPVQNLVAADAAGGMLFTVLGRVPERGKGDGRLPVPGWDLAYAWRGLRPQARNPTITSPEDGLLVTANDDVRTPGYALPFTAEFASDHRARRIRELLAARSDWRPEEMAHVQCDVISLCAREVVRALPEDLAGDAASARAALAAWDGSMQLFGASALFALFEHEIFETVFQDELDLHGIKSLPGYARFDTLLRALRGELDAAWFDDARTKPVEEAKALVDRALANAWRAGRERFGPDVGSWDYGALHSWFVRHPLGELPLVGFLFHRGSMPLAGSGTCVAAFSGKWRNGKIEIVHGPSMRWVADTGDPDRSLAVLPAGQSGHPFDRHYDDQLPVFLSGHVHGVHWSEDAIRDATVSILTLGP